MNFQDIISGVGNFTAYGHGAYESKDLAPWVTCGDGTTLSVQASHAHYCKPRTDQGPYSHVEVGYPSVPPPETWEQYADGAFPSDVYAYVPVELVHKFIVAHGGEVQ